MIEANATVGKIGQGVDENGEGETFTYRLAGKSKRLNLSTTIARFATAQLPLHASAAFHQKTLKRYIPSRRLRIGYLSTFPQFIMCAATTYFPPLKLASFGIYSFNLDWRENRDRM